MYVYRRHKRAEKKRLEDTTKTLNSGAVSWASGVFRKDLESQNDEQGDSGTDRHKSGSRVSDSSARSSDHAQMLELIQRGSSWKIDVDDLEISKDKNGNEIVLGVGGFGRVVKGIRHGVQDVAIKMATTDNEYFKQGFIKEAEIMKTLQDKNIVQLYGVCNVKNTLMVIMELMDGGDLEKALLNRKNAAHFKWKNYGKKIAIDIIKAIVFIHQKKIVHRDIKLKNILLDGDLKIAKLADVGVARILVENEGLTYVGTPQYLAPEVISGSYGTAADMYSFGVVRCFCIRNLPGHHLVYVIFCSSSCSV